VVIVVGEEYGELVLFEHRKQPMIEELWSTLHKSWNELP